MARSRRVLSGSGGPAATPRDLPDGTAEVEVDVVYEAFANQPGDGLAYVVRVHAVELQAAGALVWTEAGELERLRVAFDEGARGDHLAHVQPGTVAAA